MEPKEWKKNSNLLKEGWKKKEKEAKFDYQKIQKGP